MVKSYLKYEHERTLGIVASPSSNDIEFDYSGQLAISPALEDVAVWNLRQNLIANRLPGGKYEVTALARSPDRMTVAVGYFDGSITIFKILSGEKVCTMRGHTAGGGITCLSFNTSGTSLLSGGCDTDIVVWDVVAQQATTRLKGHKNWVTGVKFLEKSGHVVSSSRDQLVKIWHLETAFCIQTLVGTRHEVSAIDVNPQETRLVVCAEDTDVRVWDLSPLLPDPSSGTAPSEESQAQYLGAFKRQSNERVHKALFSSDTSPENGGVLLVQGPEKFVEIFAVHSEAKASKKTSRRKKRSRERGESDSEVQRQAQDEFAPFCLVRTQSKAKGSSIHVDTAKSAIRVLVALNDNAIECFELNNKLLTQSRQSSAAEEKAEAEAGAADQSEHYSKVCAIDSHGHRGDVRALAMSDDDSLMASVSSGSLKIWNANRLDCIRTLATGYGLCVIFAPGNRHVLVGTKSGELHLFDLNSATLIETFEAHKGAVWTMALRPKGDGIVTAGADREVKFWDFALVSDEETKTRRLSLTHVHTLEMSDEVLSVRFSKDGKFMAIALLDNTAKVFFVDSLKFFLSLYGHHLPVLCLDMSFDSRLIITGSADKCIKIWGLEFGDCHRSLLAHEDSVTAVQFVNKTHYFFSVGKDKKIKYWDGGKFEQIMVIGTHQREIWGLVVSADSQTVATCGHDRSVRVYRKTDEQVFIEEEKEKEQEEEYEKSLEHDSRHLTTTAATDALTELPAHRTIEGIKAGEMLIEAVDLAQKEFELREAFQLDLKSLKDRGMEDVKVAPPPANPLLLGLDPHWYVYRVIQRTRASDLEEGLSIMPFPAVCNLLAFVDKLLKEGADPELCGRVVLFVMHIHHNGFVAKSSFSETLQSICTTIKDRLKLSKDSIGFNLAALTFVQRQVEAKQDSRFFDLSAIKAQNKVLEKEKERVKRRKIQVAPMATQKLVDKFGTS